MCSRRVGAGGCLELVGGGTRGTVEDVGETEVEPRGDRNGKHGCLSIPS